jgi:hypothetical protein
MLWQQGNVKPNNYYKPFNLLFLLLFVITFMQDTYNYIPETIHISQVYSACAGLG